MRVTCGLGFAHPLQDEIGKLSHVAGLFDFANPKSHAKSFFNGDDKRDMHQRSPFGHILGRQLARQFDGIEKDVVKDGLQL